MNKLIVVFIFQVFLVFSTKVTAMGTDPNFLDICDGFFEEMHGGYDDTESERSCDEGQEDREKEEQIRSTHRYEIMQRRAKRFASTGMKASIAGLISYYLMSNPNFLMFAGFISMGFREKINQAISSFNLALFSSEQMKTLEELELQLKLLKNIPNDRALWVKEKISELQSSCASSNRHDRSQLQRGINRLGKVLRLPTESKALSKPLKSYLKKIEKSMSSTYDEKLVEKLKLLIFQIVNDSQNAAKDNAKHQKSTFYFLGIPGTGKTTTANLIAKTLELPFCQINLSKIDPRELTCSDSDGPGGHPSQVFGGKIAEGFLQKQQEKPALNTIVFLDEAHDALNRNSNKSLGFQSMLKRLLDPDVGHIRDDTLQANIDISRAIFILAGNNPVDDTCNALVDRMTTYLFKPPDDDARILIAKSQVNISSERYNLEADIIDFDNDDTIKQILKTDADFHEGVRPLQRVINSYVRYIAASNKDLLGEDYEFNVKREFDDARGVSFEQWSKKIGKQKKQT